MKPTTHREDAMIRWEKACPIPCDTIIYLEEGDDFYTRIRILHRAIQRQLDRRKPDDESH